MTALLQVGLIVLLRVGALFLVAPVFSSRSIAPMIRTALCLLLTLTLLSVVPVPSSPIPTARFAALLGVQVVVGALQGLLFAALLIGLQMVGDLFDLGVGISMATVLDPTDTTSHAIFGRLFGIFGWATFLALDGHLVVLSCLIDSLRSLPPYAASLPHALLAAAIGQLAGATAVAWRLGAPLIGLLALLDVLTGMLSRAVPQLQVMQFSFGIKQTLAVMSLALFFGGLADAASRQILALQLLLRG